MCEMHYWLLHVSAENLGCSADLSQSYLMDFGTVRLRMDEFSAKGMTPNYMSPESCRREHCHKSDVWAAAASVVYLYTLRHPFSPDSFHPREQAKYRDPRNLINYVRTHA